MIKLATGLAALLLAGCSSLAVRSTAYEEEAVEGDPASYPAFEAAARSCSFDGIRKVTVETGGSHFLITYSLPMTHQTRCLLDWLENDADGRRLFRSGH